MIFGQFLTTLRKNNYFDSSTLIIVTKFNLKCHIFPEVQDEYWFVIPEVISATQWTFSDFRTIAILVFFHIILIVPTLSHLHYTSMRKWNVNYSTWFVKLASGWTPGIAVLPSSSHSIHKTRLWRVSKWFSDNSYFGIFPQILGEEKPRISDLQQSTIMMFPAKSRKSWAYPG